jgi:hypothetical protein
LEEEEASSEEQTVSAIPLVTTSLLCIIRNLLPPAKNTGTTA